MTCIMKKPYSNNKGADLPAHLHSLISIFVAGLLDSITSIDTISEVSRLLHVASVAEQADLSLTWTHNSQGKFSHDEARIYLPMSKPAILVTLLSCL